MVQLLPILHLTILSLIIYYQLTLASGADKPTKGFARVHLDSSNFIVEKPYDVPVDERYNFINGVHRFWVYSTDKPHMPSSNTKPRTEIRIAGNNYTSGVWQFEGYGYVPSGTTGVCIMQVFGGTSSATTLQLRVYNGSLTYYRSPVVAENIYDRWFKVNAIHDVGASSVKVYINGVLKYEGADRGAGTHYFKFGVYEQNDPSDYMESRWKDIKTGRDVTNFWDWEDIRRVRELMGNFQDVQLVHIQRNRNNTTDSLAREACRNGSSVQVWKNPPSFVYASLFFDAVS